MTDDPKAQAIHWMLRVRAGDMDTSEWDAFTDWLEQSPEHSALLDEAEAADQWFAENAADLTPPLSASAEEAKDLQASGGGELASSENDREIETLPLAANDNQLKRFLPFAGLVAAAIAIFALWPSAVPTATLITTEPGETRMVAVSDDITMTLNGGGEVTLIEEETRVQIARGEVAFDIDTEEPSPLRVEVGELVLTDYGTVFNVILSDASVSVAVAEGVVGINPDRENVEVEAGQKVTKDLAGGALVRSEVDPETVGAWSEGRLEFDDTPASEAVAMLQRSIGSKVTLAVALREERLTGTLMVSDSERETVTQFAEFLGARARRGRLQGVGMVWDVR
ncbi:MAG: FecR domain-containing protein [Pseudomonadota bacterium]